MRRRRNLLTRIILIIVTLVILGITIAIVFNRRKARDENLSNSDINEILITITGDDIRDTSTQSVDDSRILGIDIRDFKEYDTSEFEAWVTDTYASAFGEILVLDEEEHWLALVGRNTQDELNELMTSLGYEDKDYSLARTLSISTDIQQDAENRDFVCEVGSLMYYEEEAVGEGDFYFLNKTRNGWEIDEIRMYWIT